MEPKCFSKDGKYYVEFAGKTIEIEEWEAKSLENNPDGIYDVIVAHTRKFNFNTAEDSGENIFTM